MSQASSPASITDVTLPAGTKLYSNRFSSTANGVDGRLVRLLNAFATPEQDISISLASSLASASRRLLTTFQAVGTYGALIRSRASPRSRLASTRAGAAVAPMRTFAAAATQQRMHLAQRASRP